MGLLYGDKINISLGIKPRACTFLFTRVHACKHVYSQIWPAADKNVRFEGVKYCVQQWDDRLVICFNQKFPSQNNVVWELDASPSDSEHFFLWFVWIVAQFCALIRLHNMPLVSSQLLILVRALFLFQISAETLFMALGSYNTSIVGWTSLSLTLLNAVSCSGPHSHAQLVLSNLLNGWVSQYFPNRLTKPRNHHRSETECGA